MAEGDDGRSNMEFYPAYCFKASPTHFSWVKMSAAVVHQLQSRPEYEGKFLQEPLSAGLELINLDMDCRTEFVLL